MTNFRLPNRKSLQTTILNLMKMAESSLKGLLRAISPFPRVLKKNWTADMQKQGHVWKRVNGLKKKSEEF